jgi:hypothetical protein
MPVRLSVAFHTFVAVLIIGTMWRVLSFHLMASNSTTLQHAGAGMSVQY